MSGKIIFEDMNNFNTNSATMRHACQKEGIYLPNHRKKMTHCHYMKSILDLSREHLLTKNVKFVHVPNYAELAPENVLKVMQLEIKDKKTY